MSTKHTVIALVEDHPGVLNRVASLFRRRGFNIDSITVGSTETEGISRMTLVVDGATTQVEQVEKQLYKLLYSSPHEKGLEVWEHARREDPGGQIELYLAT